MKYINFEITEQDIKEYLKQHKNDEIIKNREAMFVEYIRKQEEITKESLEILTKKYNWKDSTINGTYHYDEFGILKRDPLKNFESYLGKIKKLDISGICHILIPTIKYYDLKNAFSINKLHNTLIYVSKKMYNGIYSPLDVIKDTIEDYRICDKVIVENDIIVFKMARGHAEHEFLTYSDLYGKDKVKNIRKIVKEGVR